MTVFEDSRLIELAQSSMGTNAITFDEHIEKNWQTRKDAIGEYEATPTSLVNFLSPPDFLR